MKTITKFVGAALTSAVFPMVAFAQTNAGFTSVDNALTTVIYYVNRLIPFLLLLATLFFFWGLARFVLNAGDEEARKAAKDQMIWGVVAVFVMVSFWGLVGFLSQTFGLGAVQATVSVAPTIPVIVGGF